MKEGGNKATKVVICVLALFSMLVVHLLVSTKLQCETTDNTKRVKHTDAQVKQADAVTAMPLAQPPAGDDVETMVVVKAEQRPQIASEERLQQIVDMSGKELTYVHPANMVTVTMAKAGSSMIWNWIYTGLTGRDWNNTECSNVHDRFGPCWKDLATPLINLPVEKRWQVLQSKHTLRVAIQREPYARLISAYKSKYTCETERFNTDKGRLVIVPMLRRQLNLSEGEPCMTVSEFADALDVARLNVGTEGFPLRQMHKIENHIRPQEYFFDEIDYDLIIDVHDLSVPERIAAVNERLPFKDSMKESHRGRYASGDAELFIPEKAAISLHAFAALSKHVPEKYIDRK